MTSSSLYRAERNDKIGSKGSLNKNSLFSVMDMELPPTVQAKNSARREAEQKKERRAAICIMAIIVVTVTFSIGTTLDLTYKDLAGVHILSDEFKSIF